jgi:hypothetical protein
MLTTPGKRKGSFLRGFLSLYQGWRWVFLFVSVYDANELPFCSIGQKGRARHSRLGFVLFFVLLWCYSFATDRSEDVISSLKPPR